jgi:hypothetical protein
MVIGSIAVALSLNEELIKQFAPLIAPYALQLEYFVTKFNYFDQNSIQKIIKEFFPNTNAIKQNVPNEFSTSHRVEELSSSPTIRNNAKSNTANITQTDTKARTERSQPDSANDEDQQEFEHAQIFKDVDSDSDYDEKNNNRDHDSHAIQSNLAHASNGIRKRK